MLVLYRRTFSDPGLGDRYVLQREAAAELLQGAGAPLGA